MGDDEADARNGKFAGLWEKMMTEADPINKAIALPGGAILQMRSPGQSI